MSSNIRLGRIAGVPISAHWSVLGMTSFVVYSLAFTVLPSLYPTAPLIDRLMAASACAFLFVLSILGDELGHAFLAKRHGIQVDGISLWILGGVAKLSRQAQTPKAEFEIALAGPLASMLIGLGFSGAALFARSQDIVGPGPAVVAWLGIVNVLIAASNLLPASPLDGGRILTAAIWKRNGDAETARLHSARCGLVAGLALIVAGVSAMMFFEQPLRPWISALVMGVFLLGAARTEVIGAAIRRRFSRTDIESITSFYPATVPGSTPVDRFASWAGTDHQHIAHPVVHWGHEPVGYLTPARGSVLSPAERSWTSVAELAVPSEAVPRAWNTESVDIVLQRMEDSYPLAVIHRVQDNQILGTVSQAQIHQLMTAPDWWGRLPDVEPASKPDFRPVGS